jgi:hypothetical protein
VTTSLTNSVTPLKVITTKEAVYKILRVSNQLLLVENFACIEVVDISNYNITSTHYFKEASKRIIDISAIDESHYLLATIGGLLKTTKDQFIKCYNI